ncbi:hypothetical protein T4D_12240 [Trichinella pseudospiralis]|uniref:Uncharacterized protein n=1 Tax=Trichinella pseudospiralis TaxID=6337 RepID=A0A0V1FYA6_TRIPS|nr:hypothetical protein T4D_12240 [Trichinella pseudospiralis]
MAKCSGLPERQNVGKIVPYLHSWKVKRTYRNLLVAEHLNEIVWLFWQPEVHSFISVGLEEGVAPWEASLSLFLSRIRKLAIPNRVQAVLLTLAAGRQLQAVLFTTHFPPRFLQWALFRVRSLLGMFLPPSSLSTVTVNLNKLSKAKFPTRPVVICDLWLWPTAERGRPTAAYAAQPTVAVDYCTKRPCRVVVIILSQKRGRQPYLTINKHPVLQPGSVLDRFNVD